MRHYFGHLGPREGLDQNLPISSATTMQVLPHSTALPIEAPIFTCHF